MENGKYFLFNDKLIDSGTPVISADNRSFRFGDGFFETMKMADESIVLSSYHFERFFSSLQALQFNIPEYFTVEYLSNQIKQLAVKNKHAAAARIRLTIFRSDGNLYDYENDFPDYIIQTYQLNTKHFLLNNDGLLIDVYTKARKSCDDFSHIKHNNFLPYAMAALWAKENKLNDAIILNNYNRLADTTIANIFFVKDGSVKTPSLSEGCIAGVMRRYLLKCLKKENIPVEESQIQTEELEEANEIFLTNSVRGIQWIKQCGKINFMKQLSEYLYNKCLKDLHEINGD